MTLRKFVPITLAILAMQVGSAQAATVEFTLDGNITMVTDSSLSNEFGLSACSGAACTDTITAFGSFDDAALTGGTGTISTASDSLDITITVGTGTTLIPSNLLGGNAELKLDGFGFVPVPFDGLFIGSSSLSGGMGGETFTSNGTLGEVIIIKDFLGTPIIDANWDAESFTVVPIPAAVWLFGSGLIGLVGIARRKPR